MTTQTITIRGFLIFLFQCLLSLVYLQVSNIYALINYVGFATWVRTPVAVHEFIDTPPFCVAQIQNHDSISKTRINLSVYHCYYYCVSVEHWSFGFVCTVVTLDSARFEKADQSQLVLPRSLHRCYAFRHNNSNNR